MECVDRFQLNICTLKQSENYFCFSLVKILIFRNVTSCQFICSSPSRFIVPAPTLAICLRQRKHCIVGPCRCRQYDCSKQQKALTHNRRLQSQYILSLAVLVAKNIDDFTTNSDIHSVNTRHKSSLYPPLLRLSKYQKGVNYTGIKVYNCLPLKIKELSGNLKHF